MIEALLSFNEEGLLIRASLTGHAFKGRKGTDLVCAAVSHLVRTAAAVMLRLAPGSRFEAKIEGNFFLDLRTADLGRKAELSTAADFFLTGLKILAEENPESLRVKIQEGD